MLLLIFIFSYLSQMPEETNYVKLNLELRMH